MAESRSLGCVWSHTQTQEWRQYLISVAKSPYLPQCLSSAADLRLENLGNRYSAPGGPHLKYDPEPNTKEEGQNWPTFIDAGFNRISDPRPHTCFPLGKSTKTTPRRSDKPLHACRIV